MGHKENIHKQYYRLPQKETDILNISKYLEAALGNSINETENSYDDDSDDNDISLDNVAVTHDPSTSSLDSDVIQGTQNNDH